MKFLMQEKLSPHKYKDNSGYLICTDAILARTGKQTYRKSEVFADSDDDSEIEVDRKYEEVFSPATLASFENKPVTWDHPDEDVTTENHNELAVGFVRDVRQGEYNGEPVILGTLVITDARAIEEIENGDHVQLSCGYDCDIIDEANPQQRNIRGNHVALCEQGRAGVAKIVDSVDDSVAQSDLEDIPNQARKEMNSANNKKAKLTEICGQLQDIVNRADKIEREDLKRRANKILKDLKIQFDIKEMDYLIVDSIEDSFKRYNKGESIIAVDRFGRDLKAKVIEDLGAQLIIQPENKEYYGSEKTVSKMQVRGALIKDDDVEMDYITTHKEALKMFNELINREDTDPEEAKHTVYNYFNKRTEDKLVQSSSKEALRKNIKTEIKAGKDPKQAAAIAYSVQRENDSFEEEHLGKVKDEDRYIVYAKETFTNINGKRLFQKRSGGPMYMYPADADKFTEEEATKKERANGQYTWVKEKVNDSLKKYEISYIKDNITHIEIIKAKSLEDALNKRRK